MSEDSIATSCAGANGDTHVGLGQGGSVVDPVTHHAHHLALTLEPLNLQSFVLRQDLAKDSRYPHLFGNGLGRSWVVPGHHHNLQTQAREGSHRCRGVLFHGVGHYHDASRLAVYGDEHRRLSLRCQLVGSPLHLPDVDAGIGKEAPVAHQHLPAVHGDLNALSRHRLEVAGFYQLNLSLGCTLYDCLAQRMLRRAFSRCYQS